MSREELIFDRLENDVVILEGRKIDTVDYRNPSDDIKFIVCFKRKILKWERTYRYDFYLDSNGNGWRWPHRAILFGRSRFWVLTSRKFARILALKAFPLVHVTVEDEDQ